MNTARAAWLALICASTMALMALAGCDTTLDPIVSPGPNSATDDDVGLSQDVDEDCGASCGPCGTLPTEGCGTCGDGVPTCQDGVVECIGGEPSLFFLDHDGDGFGRADARKLSCGPQDNFTATRSGDCDDDEATAWPGAPERCDGIDNDCDDHVDEDEDVALDMCQEVFGARPTRCDDRHCRYTCLAGRRDHNDDLDDGSQGDGCECDETEEICDGLDNDCDGDIDEGFATRLFYKDADRDSYGDEDQAVEACAPPPNHVLVIGDCDDRDPAIHPGSLEICDNLDNDCDGRVDAQRCDSDGEGDVECGDPPLLETLLSSCELPSHAFAESCDDGSCHLSCDDAYEDRNNDLSRGEVGDGCETLKP